MGLLRRVDPDSLLWYGYAGMFFSVPLATSPTAVCGGFVLFVWVVSGRFLKDVPAWFHSDLKIPVLALMILPWLGLLYTPVPDDGFPIAVKTHYWFYAIAMGPLLSMRRRPDFLIRMFLAGLSLNSGIAILQFAGLLPLKNGVAVGLLGGSSAWIAFSLLLTTGMLVASFYFSKADSQKTRLLYGVVMLQYFFTLGFIGGRSGYVALAVLLPVIAYNMVGQRHIVKTLVVSILAASLFFAFPVVRSRFAQAVEDISQYRHGNVNTSLGLRFSMWEIAVNEIKGNVLLGKGTAGFAASWERNKKDPTLPAMFHPHSSFLFMMVSYGIAGLVAFCWLLLLMLRKGWKGRRGPLGFAVFAFTIVFAIGSLTDTQVLVFATAVALPLFAGLAEGIDVSGKRTPGDGE
ncbi:MAG: O-antigen ligase family protein [Nitrospirae bacterium]|nr:O-antigen ligase family protein [Nitrospirota bacterium]